MNTLLETLAFTLSAVLLVVVGYLAVIGLLAAFTGARWVRCPQCHHHALSRGTVVHVDGCPSTDLERLAHTLAAFPRHLHVGARRHPSAH